MQMILNLQTMVSFCKLNNSSGVCVCTRMFYSCSLSAVCVLAISETSYSNNVYI